MSVKTLAAATLLAAAAVVSLPGDANAGVERQVVRGRLEPVAAESSSHGRFRMAIADRTSGAHVERIEAFARRLDTTVPEGGSAPEFHVFLIKGDGSAAADFGAMRVNQYGNGYFLFDTRRTDLPDGVTTIDDYGGGTIELRNGDTAVLTGDVPEFGSVVYGHDRERLVSTSTSFAGRGVIIARRQQIDLDVAEQVRVTCFRMENAATYTVVVVADDSTETELGSFTTSDPLGIGGLRLSTRLGDTIGGGGVLDLAGQRVEVRDASANVVLEGTFPTIE